MSADAVFGRPDGDLAGRLGNKFSWAVDTDEVAALLESTGLNDRTAGSDFGQPSVFALAGTVRRQAASRAAVAPTPRVPLPVADVLARAVLYLTPMVVALAAAPEIDGVNPIATIGALICGWGVSQGLAYVGYGALGAAGKGTAARTLATGFTLAAAVWVAVLAGTGAAWPRAYIVAGAQLALFAATGAALVTAHERRVLAAASGCWVAALALVTVGGRWALAATLAALLLVLVVAFLPLGTRRTPRGAGLWLPGWRRLGTAAGYAAVGTGQAVLFVQVVLGRDPHVTGVPVQMIPLLVCVPLIELALAWHQRRVAQGRARLDNRADFRRHLGQVSRATVITLTIPVLVGGAMAAFGGARAGTVPLLTESVLTVAVFALCLVLAAHHRLLVAALVVWWPAAVTVLVRMSTPAAAALPADGHRVIEATLIAAALLGLFTAAYALRDPRSYQ